MNCFNVLGQITSGCKATFTNTNKIEGFSNFNSFGNYELFNNSNINKKEIIEISEYQLELFAGNMIELINEKGSFLFMSLTKPPKGLPVLIKASSSSLSSSESPSPIVNVWGTVNPFPVVWSGSSIFD